MNEKIIAVIVGGLAGLVVGHTIHKKQDECNNRLKAICEDMGYKMRDPFNQHELERILKEAVDKNSPHHESSKGLIDALKKYRDEITGEED